MLFCVSVLSASSIVVVEGISTIFPAKGKSATVEECMRGEAFCVRAENIHDFYFLLHNIKVFVQSKALERGKCGVASFSRGDLWP